MNLGLLLTKFCDARLMSPALSIREWALCSIIEHGSTITAAVYAILRRSGTMPSHTDKNAF